MKVWVYGTLRPGGALHYSYMRNAEHLGQHTMTGRLFYVTGWYPGFDPDPEGYEVVGDLFIMQDGDFAKLARMEEAAGFTTHLGADSICYFAFHADEETELVEIESGDWMNRGDLWRAVAINDDDKYEGHGPWRTDEQKAIEDAQSMMAMGIYYMVYLEQMEKSDA